MKKIILTLSLLLLIFIFLHSSCKKDTTKSIMQNSNNTIVNHRDSIVKTNNIYGITTKIKCTAGIHDTSFSYIDTVNIFKISTDTLKLHWGYGTYYPTSSDPYQPHITYRCIPIGHSTLECVFINPDSVTILFTSNDADLYDNCSGRTDTTLFYGHR